MLSLILALCLASPLAPPSRVLLVADPMGHGYEQALLFRALLLHIESSPHQTLLSDAHPTASLRTGARLTRRSNNLCDRANQALQRLNPEQARDLAEQAVSLAERVVVNTGGTTSLSRALLLAAVAYDALGHGETAQRLLMRAAQLTPHLLLDRTMFPPHLRDVVQAARHSDRRRLGRTLKLSAHPPEAALFWDGAFVGFGSAQVFLGEALAHQAVALAPGYSARIQTFERESSPAEATLALLPDPGHYPGADIAEIVSKSRIPDAFVDPQDSLLETWSVDAVWVLRYDMGVARLTQFDLNRGRRETRTVSCVLTSLTDAEEMASDLANFFSRDSAAH